MATTVKSSKPRKPAKPVKEQIVEEQIVDRKTEAKAKFSKALDEAKAGAAELAHEARERAGVYREKAVAKSGDWVEEARAYGEQAKVKAGELAVQGKTRASDALSGLGKLVSDNADTIDDRVGTKYGDYARSASRKMQETAAAIEAKDFEELGEEAREFVRKSPGLAIGMAAVAGFMLARLFTGSRK
jgi:ElaB/YqjD/DUF883 family membrane-anchored ribosome-binding protein